MSTRIIVPSSRWNEVSGSAILAAETSGNPSPVTEHTLRKDNPHQVTAEQVGAYSKEEADQRDAATLAAALANPTQIVTLAGTQFGAVTIPQNTAAVWISGDADVITVNLPASPANGQRIAIETPTPRSRFVSMGFTPAVGNYVSDGVRTSGAMLPVQVEGRILLRFDSVDSTWRIDVPALISPGLSIDLIEGTHSYGYQVAPVAKTLDELLTVTRAAGGATYIDASGIIRDAPANTLRPVHELAPPHRLRGYSIEVAETNQLTNSVGYTWRSGTVISTTTDLPALYQGDLVSGNVWKSTCQGSTSNFMAHWGGGINQEGLYFGSIYVWVPTNHSFTRLYVTASGNNITSVDSKDVDFGLLDQWQRVWVVANHTGTIADECDVVLRHEGGNAGESHTDILYVTCPMLSRASAATSPGSYIPTTSGAYINRGADVVALNAALELDTVDGLSLSVEVIVPNPAASNRNLPEFTFGIANAASTASILIQGDGDPITRRIGTKVLRPRGAVAGPVGSSLDVYGPVATAVSVQDRDAQAVNSDGTENRMVIPMQPAGLIKPVLTAGSAQTLLRKLSYYPQSLSLPALRSISQTVGPHNASLDDSSPGYVIPQDFVGFSFETSRVQDSVSLSNRTDLKNILRPLSRGSLRFGGNTSDYNTTGPYPSGTPNNFYPSDARVTSAANFANALGSNWNIIWGLNFGRQDVAQSVATIAALTSVVPLSRIQFQIGNEPGYENQPVDYATYITGWLNLYNGIIATYPTARFIGPDVGSLNFRWIPNFSADLGSRVEELTLHLYSFDGDGAASRTDTEEIMARTPAVAFAEKLTSYASATGKKARITEDGSNGNPNIGNALAGAMRNLYFMTRLAKTSARGVNFHGGTGEYQENSYGQKGTYSPIINVGGTLKGAAPYYAMLMMDRLVGSAVIPFTTTAHSLVDGLGVIGQDGKPSVLLTNRMVGRSAVLNLAVPAGRTSATLMLMTAPRQDSLEITLGNAKVAPNGDFFPVASAVPISGGVAKVSIPPASAALVTFS